MLAFLVLVTHVHFTFVVNVSDLDSICHRKYRNKSETLYFCPRSRKKRCECVRKMQAHLMKGKMTSVSWSHRMILVAGDHISHRICLTAHKLFNYWCLVLTVSIYYLLYGIKWSPNRYRLYVCFYSLPRLVLWSRSFHQTLEACKSWKVWGSCLIPKKILFRLEAACSFVIITFTIVYHFTRDAFSFRRPKKRKQKDADGLICSMMWWLRISGNR